MTEAIVLGNLELGHWSLFEIWNLGIEILNYSPFSISVKIFPW
jgi:hypothetical protein